MRFESGGEAQQERRIRGMQVRSHRSATTRKRDNVFASDAKRATTTDDGILRMGNPEWRVIQCVVDCEEEVHEGGQ